MADPSERLYLRTGGFELGWPAHAQGESAFHQAAPGPALAGHVTAIRWGHETIPSEAPIEERIVPDGTIQLLFDFAGPRVRGLVLGAKSDFTLLELSGRIEHLCLELAAGAVPALFRVPARELTGREIDLEELWGDLGAELCERLSDARAAEQRIAVVEQVLARELGRRDARIPPAVGEALRRIRRASSGVRIRELASDLGLSDRRLEQLFQAHVGLSPKVMSRIVRLQALVERLAGGARSWADVALECGFSDQSHLVNELRSLTGLAPEDFRKRAGFGFLQD